MYGISARLCACSNKFNGLSVTEVKANKSCVLKIISAHVNQQFSLSSNDCKLRNFVCGKEKTGRLFLRFVATNKSQLSQKRFVSSMMEKYLTSSYFVNGEWKNTKSTFPVYNPYTKNVIAEAANCTKSDAEDAITHAVSAFKQWKKTTGKVQN